MTQFDEDSVRNWEDRRRQSRRRPSERNTDTGRLMEERQRLRAERNGTLNPDWRRDRATRRRRNTGVIGSPQEIALWMQKGGWVVPVVAAVLLVGMLAFLLSRGESADTANPFGTTSAGTEQQAPGTASSADAAAGEGTGNPASSADGASADVFQPTPTPEPATPSSAFYVVTNTGGQGLFLRAEASTGSTALATLPEGARVEVIGEEQAGANYVWRNVRTEDGTEGWVAIDFLIEAP